MNLGHGDEIVINALADQLRQVDSVHATTFTTGALEQYASELAPLVPVADARIYPVSGGSEAIETACKLAHAYHLARGDADRHIVLARHGSYHGNTRGALDLSGRDPLRAPYLPWLGLTERVPALYPYRVELSGAEHAARLEETIVQLGPSRVAAFVAEPIGGATTGASVPPDDYWPLVADVCRRHGVLLVADEVMTGFGRTGAWFACSHWDVQPDVLVAGKGASSGYWPLGLVIASGSVHDTVQSDGGFVHGFTWSHHPGGAAVGRAVLQRMADDNLVDRSRVLGARLLDQLRDAARGRRDRRRRARPRAADRRRARRGPDDEDRVPARPPSPSARPGRRRISGCSSTRAPGARTASTATSSSSAPRSSSPTPSSTTSSPAPRPPSPT